MKEIIDAMSGDFEPLDGSAFEYPRFAHRASGIPFQYVPGGEYLMGFSDDEQRAAKALSPVLHLNIEEMRPVQRRSVQPLLVSLTPVSNKQTASEYRDHGGYPAYFDYDAATQFAGSLGCRLPKETEWEYFYRAGTHSLFPFGDLVPSEDILAKWLDSNFESVTQLACNDFGLYGLTNPEWCQEKFTNNLADGASLYDGSYTVRGGGAYFWPWQDDEWIWCVSAMRSPSSALEDGKACLRLVSDVKLID